MAGFRELPLVVNVLLAVAVAVLVVGGGLYIPGSPLQAQRIELDKAIADEAQLTQEVQALQVYKRKHAELQADIAAQQKQLETLRTIVPEEKEVDEFIRMIHTAAASSNVELRRLTAKPAPETYRSRNCFREASMSLPRPVSCTVAGVAVQPR